MGKKKLNPWQLNQILTPTRTRGQIRLSKNGTQLDIWIREGGKPTWFAVNANEVRRFLESDAKSVVLCAESDGNAE